MNTVETTKTNTDTIEIPPNYNIALILVFLSIPLIFWQIWLGIFCSLLGLFLMFQTVRISLCFTSKALEVYLSKELIRTFPYEEWENWRIFWRRVPILLYFKEVKSIHFIPIICNAKILRECLEKYCPQKQ